MVGTAFGEKKFKLSEINRICVIDKNGEEREVLAEVKKIFEANDSSTESKFRLFKKKSGKENSL